jgi:hypothetical protein
VRLVFHVGVCRELQDLFDTVPYLVHNFAIGGCASPNANDIFIVPLRKINHEDVLSVHCNII